MRYAITLLVPLLVLVAACDGGGDGQPAPTASPASHRPSPTPEEETLAFIRDGDIWLINADGTGERRLTRFSDTDREVVAFQWLAGGQEIAHEASLRFDPETPPPSTVTSVLANTDGAFLWERELSRSDTRVLWSPDGQLVALFDQIGVTVEARDGRSQWTGTFQPAPFGGESWSRDGKALAFIDGEEIVVVSGDPLAAQRLDMFSAGCPAGEGCPASTARYGVPEFTPDGNSLVTAIAREGEIGAVGNANFAVYRIDLIASPATKPLRFPAPGQDPDGKDFGSLPQPVSSPDGRYVAYGSSVHMSACEGGSALVILHDDGISTFIPAEIEQAAQAFTPEGPDTGRGTGIHSSGLQWSPTADTLVTAFRIIDCSFMGEANVALKDMLLAQGVYVVRGDGSGEEKVADEFPLATPVWSPSGRLVAYASGDPESPWVRIVDPATRRATDLGPGDSPAWQPQP